MDLVSHLSDRLLFAIPKKGRLQQACLDLLQGADIQYHRLSRLDIALVKNLNIALIFLPAADIPTFIGEGRVDLGITGRDQVAEYEAGTPPTDNMGVEEVLDLGFGKCGLHVQVPEQGSISQPEQLVGKTIVTSFTQITEEYFANMEREGGDTGSTTTVNGDSGTPTPKLKLKTQIKYVGGSVEAACALGVADGIVDLVESGDTMRAAGLKSIALILSSSAVLIKSKHASHPALVSLLAARIQGFITAQRYVLCTYNVHRSALDVACQITPGKRAPTINSLEEKDWVAVQSMVPKEQIAVVMDDLIVAGAEDILVVKIANSRTN